MVFTWVGTALLLLGAVLDGVFGDGKGALLLGVVTVATGAFATHWSVVRPRLSADAEGLVARTLRGTHRLPWAETTTRVRTTRRLGRDGVTLELEHEDELYIFGRVDLGEDPRDVLDVLTALRSAL
ncbi:PH domain-containing protein [Amycolatopsis rhabdoformis]|uniref:PH domain-containing protein n=1 Tax=Amycolatopsis rhabdoformis TaxID=1448059 RepID=A0ABZ1I3B7_9PSEU|nr:PH domain-containing protein [Amycolatopsis rhabdoformis]WSE28431.1 PH domain-containing protein [Amycolatopsis rhabdoformis]